VTALLAMNRHPTSYTAIEGDEETTAQVRCLLAGSNRQCRAGSTAET
jgi:hypothetical protein